MEKNTVQLGSFREIICHCTQNKCVGLTAARAVEQWRRCWKWEFMSCGCISVWQQWSDSCWQLLCPTNTRVHACTHQQQQLYDLVSVLRAISKFHLSLSPVPEMNFLTHRPTWLAEHIWNYCTITKQQPKKIVCLFHNLKPLFRLLQCLSAQIRLVSL